MRVSLGALLLVFAGAGPVLAQAQIAASRYYKAVDHGQRIKVTAFVSLDQGCRSMGETRINLVREPQGGTIETARGSDYPGFAPTNPRAACNRHRAPATLVMYHAGGTFTGVDTFDIEAVSPDGTARKYRYAVVVR